MPIIEVQFDNEAELQKWVQANVSFFLKDCFFLDGFRITTSAGKGGVPDGFAINFKTREWYIIESELLAHGVWPHIAEQLTRFVVASQNSGSVCVIRDKAFDFILETGRVNECADQLKTTKERLLQQIEVFLESVPPGFVIFIDDTNQDLLDVVHALEAPTQIFRVRKLVTDGKIEYYSPDHRPVIDTEPAADLDAGPAMLQTLEQLGGGQLLDTTRRFKCYQTTDGHIVHIKYSKLHEHQNYYWFGITPTAMDSIDELGVTHVVLILGSAGFVAIPVSVLREYLKTARVTRNPDGSVRHYHLLVSREPEPELFWSAETPRYDLSECFSPFD